MNDVELVQQAEKTAQFRDRRQSVPNEERPSGGLVTGLLSILHAGGFTSGAKHVELSAGGNSVPSISWSSLVAEMAPNSKPPSLWKEYAQFLQKPIMLIVLTVPVQILVNDISSITAKESFGVIRVLPYIIGAAFVVVITMFWWLFKRKEPRFRLLKDLVHTRDATSGGKSLKVARTGDAPQDVKVTINDPGMAGESTSHQSAGGRGNGLAIDPSISSPPSQHKDGSVTQSETSESTTSDCPAERSGGGSQQLMIDSRNGHLSSGSSGRGASGEVESSSEGQRESMYIVVDAAGIAILKKAVEELQPQSGPYAVFIVNCTSISALVERIKPRANMPGSRVLHKRIEIGLQTGNWWEDFLDSEVIEPMTMAQKFDKDCTMQLDSVAVFKHTDAGLKCWMLRKDWTPVILDVYRSPQTILDLLTGKSPKCIVRGFNLENATLKVGISETERSTDVTILHYKKIENVLDELLFEEPSLFTMFSKRVYISASNTVEVEAGVTFKLHSEATKVQREFWVSVLDGLIPSPWTGILIASWLLLLGGHAVLGSQWDFFEAYGLAIVLSLGIATYLLHVHGFDVPSHGILPGVEGTTSSSSLRATAWVEDALLKSFMVSQRGGSDVPSHGIVPSVEGTTSSSSPTAMPRVEDKLKSYMVSQRGFDVPSHGIVPGVEETTGSSAGPWVEDTLSHAIVPGVEGTTSSSSPSTAGPWVEDTLSHGIVPGVEGTTSSSSPTAGPWVEDTLLKSSTVSEQGGAELDQTKIPGPRLGDLPQRCIECILRLTTPRDVARLASVNRNFYASSFADSVWETMLPPFYPGILAKIVLRSTCSKKEIYDFLCNGVLLQNGKYEYWLDRATGGICQMIGARGLDITWGDDRRYWDLERSRRGSRFTNVAYLKEVWWLHISGRLECFLSPGAYTLSWRIFHEFTRDVGPVVFTFEATGNAEVETACCFTPEGAEPSTKLLEGQQQSCICRWDQDNWMELDVGEFLVEDQDFPISISFSLRETETTQRKADMYFDGVMIRPSYVIANEKYSHSRHEAGSSANLPTRESIPTASSNLARQHEQDELGNSEIHRAPKGSVGSLPEKHDPVWEEYSRKRLTWNEGENEGWSDGDDVDPELNEFEEGWLRMVHAEFIRKVWKSDYKEALEVLSGINQFGNPYIDGFVLQEKGIAKRMMGDLVGALQDLTDALGIFLPVPDTSSQLYDCWKHRGYVSFLLGDLERAQLDGKTAMQTQLQSNTKFSTLLPSLGEEPVTYMDFQLTGLKDMIEHEKLMLSLHSRAMQKVDEGSDFLGALALFDVINTRVLPYQSRAFFLTERGILKRMAGDLNGALEDLTSSLKTIGYDYECRKHRGFVKYLMRDEEGARRDAETCLIVRDDNARKHHSYNFHASHETVSKSLAATRVQFLGFSLD